jgi:hypothetical protein
MATSCNDQQPTEKKPEAEPASARGTFAYDLHFLQQHDSGLIQLKAGNSAVLVSPRYQAKVFTSTAEGAKGKSFGWINYKAFSAPSDPHMNAFGGENRFWLGPEGGRYSLYFKKGDSMIFANWKTPPAIDTEEWEVATSDSASVSFKKNIELNNYTGSKLSISIDRSIAIQDRSDIEKTLSVQLDDSVNAVGYSTLNIITNSGKEEWNEKTGMPCIWILDMFNPSDETTIVIPYKSSSEKEKVATTNYFGEISPDRIRYTGNVLLFRADGKQRGKLGILPNHVLPVAGSYDAKNKVLTITSFSIDNKGRYLNQVWNTVNPVFTGDAMNAYNDGPLENGSQMGPFYEIESVSPAAALKPGAALEHHHKVYHFTGNESSLNKIALKVLGISLADIQHAFK